jgi:hypothetical protein
MRHDDIDRILSREESILPSSGFASSVMEAVRHEASAPPPIPFPWKRAWPGMAVAALTLACVVVVALTQWGRGTTAPALPAAWQAVLAPILKVVMSAGMSWSALALLLALASVTLSMRLASGRI